MARSNTRSRDEVVGVIVALLVSEKPPSNIPVSKLDSNYRQEEGERIPHKELGYPTLIDFLGTIPSLQLHHRNGLHYINFLGTEKTSHVSALVAKQRPSSKSHRRRPPRHHPLPSNYFSNPPRTPAPRINDSMTSQVLEMLKNEPRGLTKMAIVYRMREKRPGVFFHVPELNEILESLGNKVEIRDNVVFPVKMNDEAHADVPWANSNEFIEESKRIVKPLHNFVMEEDDGEDLDDFSYVSAERETPEVNGDAGAIVNERMRFRLEKLIQNRPKGIWCADLPRIFKDEYKIPLEWEELGFTSLSDLVLQLPEVFRCIQPNPAGDFQLFHAKSEGNSGEIMRPTLASVYKVYEDPEDDVPAVPATIPSYMVNNLIPDDVVPMGESIGQIPITCFNQDDKGYEEVVVCDAFSPSFFWIQLRRKQLKLGDMMDSLEDFYNKYHSKYNVPLIILEKGLNVACQFYGKWHRGIVKAVEPDQDSTTTILYYDYGTLHKHPASEIRFLQRRFSQLPAQAIPCGLYNIKPNDLIKTPEGIVKSVWPIQTSRTFVQRVHDKPLVAMCGKMHHENNSLLISLTDTSSEEDVNIGDWLVDNGLAIHGTMVRIKGKNFQYKHYLESLKSSQKIKKSWIKNLINSTINLAPNKLSNPESKVISKIESLRAKIFGKISCKLNKKKCPSCGFILNSKEEKIPEKIKVNDYNLTKPKAESSSESRKGSSSDSGASSVSLPSEEAPDLPSSISKDPASSVIVSKVTNEDLDEISEFETIVKPRATELKSGVVDWAEARAAAKGLSKTPRPISPAKPTRLEIMKSIKRRKREIVDADGDFIKIIDKSIQGIKKVKNLVKTPGVITPMVRQALKNIKSSAEASRISVSVDEFGDSVLENSCESDWNLGANNGLESRILENSPVKSVISEGSVSTVIDLSADAFNSTRIDDFDEENEGKVIEESGDSIKTEEITGVYKGFLKNSSGKLKEIIYSSTTDDFSELDSDDSDGKEGNGGNPPEIDENEGKIGKIIPPADLTYEIPVFNDLECESDDEEFDFVFKQEYQFISDGKIGKFLLNDDNNNDCEFNSGIEGSLEKIEENNEESMENASDFGIEDIPRSESDEIYCEDDDDVEEVSRSPEDSENSFLSHSILEEITKSGLHEKTCTLSSQLDFNFMIEDFIERN